jgi:hypothetical protein
MSSRDGYKKRAPKRPFTETGQAMEESFVRT